MKKRRYSYQQLEQMKSRLPQELLAHIHEQELLDEMDRLYFFVTNDPRFYDPKRQRLHSWHMRMSVEAFFDLFGKYAARDPEVARRLHEFTAFAVQALGDAAGQSPDLFKPIAETEWCWPMNTTTHPSCWPALKDYLSKLHLGEKCNLSLGGQKRRTWSPETRETYIALNLWQTLNHLRQGRRAFGDTVTSDAERAWWDALAAKARTLAPLDRTNYRQWWAVVQPLFYRRFGLKFEDHPDFKTYWDNTEYGEKGAKLSRDARALIRRDIKAQIKQSLRSLAPSTAV